MSTNKIPVLDLKPQYQALKNEIQAAINAVLESSQFIMGPEVKRFEEEVAAYLGVKHAIGVNSGTDALVIGLKALGIGEGDEVITTPFSFFATAESISNVGGKPVFVDINPHTYNIDPKAIKEQITSRTKAIMPVHLYGNPAAMGQIMDIAQIHGLKIIEDCAQSFGAKYHGSCSFCQESCQESTRAKISDKLTGTIGNVGAFSFFPSKNLGAYGDGGLIATDDDKIAESARMLRVHGAKKKYRNEILGYNSRLDSLQAAILRVKLKYIDEWNQGRCRVAKTYNDLLADVDGIITPELADGHVFHQYTIRVLDGRRDSVKQYLAEQGIGSMIYYPVPQDKLPVYQGQYSANAVSDMLATEVLSLPIWPELKEADIKQIAGKIKEILTCVNLG
ncbi:DegT/DnrJ/EryC1/StrS family aminotransferase [Mastigocoleus sp. MO_188.B34]|uniref:DegT/DnrJ/EryC1/StrS family aminotransferase n=1 Tax=Mastigocoleus sp. MO_188.B34 TaxID=3036635 RepID=UPI002628FFEF|nr:DegT/DnrJ/EryC1/StrS family aminotransferase [Mastigocoleus sp. MO_188.B34]MDJ0697126.1 DegT/DnrJ/EryC1/StrS family aminotransferase [Mastigocoleus sp. MO_188.B34]